MTAPKEPKNPLEAEANRGTNPIIPEETLEATIDRLIWDVRHWNHKDDEGCEKAKQEALDRINKLMDEVIGQPEDERLWGDYSKDATTSRNQLRTEQRQRLAKLFEGEQ